MTQRAGIAGTGFMARTHAEQYVRMDDVAVAAAAAPSGAKPFLDERGFDDATAYTDVADLVSEADVDFLDVCTPTDTHLEVVRAAAESGVDVILEKPIAGSVVEAEAIRRIASESGITLMVGHVLRFFPEYVAAKNQDIGTPGVARARRLSPFPTWGSDDWYRDRERSGGVFLDLAIHDLDYLRWCWGDVAEVFARRFRDPEAEHGFVTLRFESGAVGYVEASWAQPASRSLTSELELAGDAGLVELDAAGPAPYREWTADGDSVERPRRRDGYYRQLAHFVDCLESGAEPGVTAADAIAALELSLAARASAERGEPVSPGEVGA